MIQIVSDSSALFDKKQALAHGYHSVPLSVMVDGVSHDDYEDISSAEMNAACLAKKEVSTSQPSIGSKLDLYNDLLENPDDIILDITLADGISGTYQSACMSKEACNDPDRVHVINSKTLCGPQQGLVLKAVEMRDNGHSLEEIKEMLEKSSATELSTVTVPEISFVLKGGRLGKMAGKAGEFLKLMPTFKKTAEDKTLGILGASRTFKKAFGNVQKFFDKGGLDNTWKLYITHADNPTLAQKAKEYYESVYPGIDIVVQELCPLFIVHGGPGCIALQAIKIEE